MKNKKFAKIAAISSAAVLCTSIATSTAMFNNIYADSDEQTSSNLVDVTFLSKNKDVAHEHVFVSKFDETNHWSECSVCGEKKDLDAHTWAITEKVDNPTCKIGSPTTKYGCKSCDATKQDPNPDHTPGSKADVMSDRREHLDRCSGCDKQIDTHLCEGTDGVIKCEESGTCSTCGQVYTLYQYYNNEYIPSNMLEVSDVTGKATDFGLENNAPKENSVNIEHSYGILKDKTFTCLDCDHQYATITSSEVKAVYSIDEVRAICVETKESDKVPNSLNPSKILSPQAKANNAYLNAAEIQRYEVYTSKTDNFDNFDKDGFEAASVITEEIVINDPNAFADIKSLTAKMMEGDCAHTAIPNYKHAYLKAVPKYEDANYPDRITSITLTKVVWFSPVGDTKLESVNNITENHSNLHFNIIGKELVNETGEATGIYNIWNNFIHIPSFTNIDTIAPTDLKATVTYDEQKEVNGVNYNKKSIVSMTAKETCVNKCIFNIYSDEGCTQLVKSIEGQKGENNTFSAAFDFSGIEVVNQKFFITASDGFNTSAATSVDVTNIDNKAPIIGFVIGN